MISELEPIYQAVLHGDAKAAKQGTEKALASGIDPLRIVQEAMTAAMQEAGQRFECREYYVPELLLAARAMKGALALVRPLLSKPESLSPAGRVVIGTVKGDLHDIGKNLVAGMLEGGGFEVIDLGVNVEPDQFVQAARDGADIVGMSALLTTTMPAMKTTIEALQQAGVRQRVKILIGGAPISQQYADEIGADGYSDSASGAVVMARSLSTLRP